MSTRGNNNNETVYEYSNTENVGANNEYAPPPQPNRPPNVRASLSPQQILDLVKSLDYSRVEAFLRELPSEQLTWFRQQPFVYVVVKEMVNQYKQRYGTDSADVASDEMLEGGLRLLNLFKENLQMNVYQGETETSKDRPGNVAARANSSIAIPILQVLMRNHKKDIDSRSFSMHILQPDGMYERKQARDGTITLTAPKGEKAPLFDAIENNQFKTVEYLVKEGSQINKIKDPVSGDSPLAVAILQSINKEIATFLKENKANVNAIDKYGEPLLQSIIRNQFNWETGMPYADGKTKGEIRLFFVDFIAKSPFYSPGRDGQERDPVYVATIQGCPRILATLLKIQSIKSFLRNSLREPFMYAASNSSYVSPDVVVNTNGKRAKMDELVKFFLQQMEFQIADQYDLMDPTRGRPIFLLESAITKDMELLRLLKNRNFLTGGYSNAFRQRLQGDTNPITYAIQKKKLDSLKVLAEHPHFKEMVKVPDDGLRLPLIEAIRVNEPEILQFLLDKNADVNKQAGRGETPLTVALETNPELVKFLIEKGANVNQPGANGETPLLLAIRTAPEFVKVLLDNGADPNQSDKNGNFPLLVALDMKNQEIVDLLKSKGARLDSLLFQASLGGKFALVKSLLEEGNVDPTGETTINGIKYSAYDLAKTTDIRLLLAPYLEKEKPRFKGFSAKDFDLFRGDYWNNIDFLKPELDWEDFILVSVCPICFFVNFMEPDYCNYVSHDCKSTGNFVHEALLKTYETVTRGGSKSAWCTSCSRMCRDRQGYRGLEHWHFSIEPPVPSMPKRELPQDNDPFRRECYVSGGGGYIVEKFFRMQELLNLMCKLNNEYIGKISIDTAYKLTREHFIGCTVPYKSFFEGGRRCKEVIDTHLFLRKVNQVKEYLQTLNDINIGLADTTIEEFITTFVQDDSLQILLAIQTYFDKHFESVLLYGSSAQQKLTVPEKAAQMKALFAILTPLKENKTKDPKDTLTAFFTELQKEGKFISDIYEEIDLSPITRNNEEAVDTIIRTIFKLEPDSVKKIIDDADKVRLEKKFAFPDGCEEVEEAVVENIVYDNVAPLVKLIKKPKVIVNPPSDYDEEVGKLPCFIHGEEGAGSKLYKFIHVQPSKNSNGNFLYHTHDDELICKWAVVDFISSYLDSQDPLECYVPNECKGNFHPMEIKFLFYSPIEDDKGFREYEQAEEEAKANKLLQVEEQKREQEYQARVQAEDAAYDEEYKVWLAGFGDAPNAPEALAAKPIDPRGLREKYKRDMSDYQTALRVKQFKKNTVVPPKPEWPAGLFQKRPVKKEDFQAKQIEWTKEEIAARKEKREAQLKAIWQKYANKWMRTAKDFIAKFGSAYNGENKNLEVENAPIQPNNGGQGGGSYTFHSVGSIPGSCKTKRVKGGYRKTRRSKKILKTRKAKRYNRTRKH